jgi:CheY-like chemotaxis protein
MGFTHLAELWYHAAVCVAGGQLMPATAVNGLPDARSIRILIVEDDALIRFAMAEALRDLGVCVIEAANADEAWDYLAADGRVDLVFTDHRMPGSMTGAQLAGRVRASDPARKVVVASADIEAGAWPEPIVRKPYDLFDTANMLVELARANRAQADET